MQEFEGKTAVITGGASGIGRGVALALAEVGTNLVIADLQREAGEETCEELRGKGVRALFVDCDVRSSASVASLVSRVREEMDGADIVCNNAGVYLGGPMREVSEEDWRWLLSVNLDGVFHVGQAFAALLREQRRGGHIVNTASVGGFLPFAEGLVYAVSKFGVVAYSEAQRADLAGDGIGVSTLCPGPIRTNLPNSDQLRDDKAQAGGKSGVLQDLVSTGMEPIEIGPIVLDGIRENAAYIFTHDLSEMIGDRFEKVMEALQRVR